MDKDKRKQSDTSDERLMERLRRPSPSDSWDCREFSGEEIEILREEISLFDTDRLLRLVQAALEIEEWPFRR